MHARELHTGSLLAERDDRREHTQGSAPQAPPTACTAEPLRGAGDILSKTETPKMRPCGVIAPERTKRPLSPPLGLHLPNRQPWPVMDTSTYKYVDSQNPPVEYVYPQRNISPRQTFQENMRRILVPPRSDLSKIISEPTAPLTSYPYQPTQAISKNPSTDPKYCVVPYVASQIPKQQRTSVVRNNELYASSVGVPPLPTRSWQAPVPPTPTAYYPSDYYAHHQSYSASAARSTQLPTKKGTDQSQKAHGENLYRGEARFEPYPLTKDKYPRARYDYVNFPNSYHSYIPPQQKCDSTKPVATPAYVNYTPQKYVDPRIVDPRIIDSHSDSYIRPSQYLPIYTAPHPDYMPTKFAAPATPYHLHNKFYGHHLESGHRQANSTAKGSYDPNRSCFEQEYGRGKPLQVNESSYMTEIPPYGFRGQVALSNYPLTHAQHRAINYMYQQRNDSSVKNYTEFLPQYKYPDIRASTHNPLARIPTQFSPNVISPSESNTSNESGPPQGTTHEDCGYVSQSSNNSGISLDCSRFKLQHYEPNSIDYRPYHMVSKSTIKPFERNNSGIKDTRNIDIRQFLQTWEEDDEDDTIKAKENFPGSHKPAENITVDAAVTPSTSEEPLYVLEYVNIPSEEIDKYEHIQKISKLPENIRGYNNADLLNKFDEAFRPASFCDSAVKTANSQHVIKPASETLASNVVGTARPPSPFDVESKITQSVIHKDVGCNFEIKPFSPPVQNLENSSVMQNNNERKIEKIVNPIIQSTTPNALQHTRESTQGTANKRYSSSDEPNTNNKVMKTIDSQSSIKNRDIEHDDIGRDYNTVSGVCLASLPRLDNEMDLNFAEINEQYNHLKDNQESVIITTTNSSSSVHEKIIIENDSADLKIIHEDVAADHADSLHLSSEEPCIYDYDQALTLLSCESSNDKSTTKLSKIRRNKPQNNMETITSQSNTSTSMPQSSPVQRTNSVIIKNPDIIENNIQNLEDFATMPHNVKQALLSTDIKPYRKSQSSWFSGSSNLSNDLSIPSASQNMNNEKFMDITQPHFHEMFPLEGSKSPINLIMHSHNEEYTKCIRPSLIHCVPNKSEDIRDKKKSIDSSDDKISNFQINNICAANEFNEIPINVAINLSINSNQLDPYTSDNISGNYESNKAEETHKTKVKENHIESNSQEADESIQNEKILSHEISPPSGKLSNVDVMHTIRKTNSNAFQTTNKCQNDLTVDYINVELNNPDNIYKKKSHNVDTFTCGKSSINQANLPAEVLSEIVNINHDKTLHAAEVTNVNFNVGTDKSENKNSGNSEKSTIDPTLNEFAMIAKSSSRNLKINNPLKVMDDDSDDQLEENIENIALHIMASGNIFNNCNNDKSLASEKFVCPEIQTEPNPSQIQLLTSDSSHNADLDEKGQNIEIIHENFTQSNYEALKNTSKTDSKKSTEIIVVDTPTTLQTVQCITDTELYHENEQPKEHIDDTIAELSQQSIFNELNVSNNLTNDNSTNDKHELDSKEFLETNKTTIIEEINYYHDAQKDFMDDSEDSLKSIENTSSLSKSPLKCDLIRNGISISKINSCPDNREFSHLTETVTSNVEGKYVNNKKTCKSESHIGETVQDNIQLVKRYDFNSDVMLNESVSLNDSLVSDLQQIQAAPIESISTFINLSRNNSPEECNVNDSGNDTACCNNSDVTNDSAVLSQKVSEPETLSTDKIKQQFSIGKDMSQRDKTCSHLDYEGDINGPAYMCDDLDDKIVKTNAQEKISEETDADYVRENDSDLYSGSNHETVKSITEETITRTNISEYKSENTLSLIYDDPVSETIMSNTEVSTENTSQNYSFIGEPKPEEMPIERVISEDLSVNYSSEIYADPENLITNNDHEIVKTSSEENISKEMVAVNVSDNYSRLSGSNHETLKSITKEIITRKNISNNKSENTLSLIYDNPVTEAIVLNTEVITLNTTVNYPSTDEANTEEMPTERVISKDLIVNYSSEMCVDPENGTAKTENDNGIVKISREENIPEVILADDVNENYSELYSGSDHETLKSFRKNISENKIENTFSLIDVDQVTEAITTNTEVIITEEVITEDTTENYPYTVKTNTEMPTERVISEDLSVNYSSVRFTDPENFIAKNYHEIVKTSLEENISEELVVVDVSETYSGLYSGSNHHETLKSITKEITTGTNISENKSENTLSLIYDDPVAKTITPNAKVITEDTSENSPYTDEKNTEEMPTVRVISEDLSVNYFSELFVDRVNGIAKNGVEISKTIANENTSQKFFADFDKNCSKLYSGTNHESAKSVTKEIMTGENIVEDKSENTLSLIYDNTVTETMMSNTELIITEEVITENTSENDAYAGKPNTEEMPTERVISKDLGENNSSEMYVDPQNGIEKTDNEIVKTSAEENISELIVADDVNESDSELYSGCDHETVKSFMEEVITGENVSEDKSENIVSLIYDDIVTETITSDTEVISEDTSDNYSYTDRMNTEEMPTEGVISEELRENYSSDMYVDPENGIAKGKTVKEIISEKAITEDIIERNLADIYGDPDHETLKINAEASIPGEVVAEDKTENNLSEMYDNPLDETIEPSLEEIHKTKKVITGVNKNVYCEINNNPGHGKKNAEDITIKKTDVGDSSAHRIYDDSNKRTLTPNREELIVQRVCMRDNFTGIYEATDHEAVKINIEENISENGDVKHIYENYLSKISENLDKPIKPCMKKIIAEKGIKDENSFSEINNENETVKINAEDVAITKLSREDIGNIRASANCDSNQDTIKSNEEESMVKKIIKEHIEDNDFSEIYEAPDYETIKINIEDNESEKVAVGDIKEEVTTEDIYENNSFQNYEHHKPKTSKRKQNKIITEVTIAEGTNEINPEIYDNRELIESNVYKIVPENVITQHIDGKILSRANDNCNFETLIDHEICNQSPKIIDSRHIANPDGTIIYSEGLITNDAVNYEKIELEPKRQNTIKKCTTAKSDISRESLQQYSHFTVIESDFVQNSTSKINMAASQQTNKKTSSTEDVFECCKGCMFIPKECSSLNEEITIQNRTAIINIYSNIDKDVLINEDNKEIGNQTKAFQSISNNMHNNIDKIIHVDIVENEDILLKKQTNYNVISNEKKALKMLIPGTSKENDTITSSLNYTYTQPIANYNNLLETLSSKENYESNSCTRVNKEENCSRIISSVILNDQCETVSNNNEQNKTYDENTTEQNISNYDSLNINKYKKGIVFDTYFGNKEQGSKQSNFSSDADTFINSQMSLIKNKNRSTRWDSKYSSDKELISKVSNETCAIESDALEKIHENTKSKIDNIFHTNFANTSQTHIGHIETYKEEPNTEYSDLNNTELSGCLSFIFDNLSRKRCHTNKDINLINTDHKVSKSEFCNSPCMSTNNYKTRSILTTRTQKSSLTSMNKVAKLFLDDKESEMVKRRRMPSLENENERNINSDVYLSKWINIDKENIAKYETSIKETEIPKDMRTNQVIRKSDHCASENECCSPQTEKQFCGKTTDFSITLTDIFEKDVITFTQEQKDDKKLDGNISTLSDHINLTNTGCEKFVLYDELWTETEVSVHPKYPKINQASTQECQRSPHNSNQEHMSTSQNLEDYTINTSDNMHSVHKDPSCKCIENEKSSTDPTTSHNPNTNLYNNNKLVNIENVENYDEQNIEHAEVKKILPEAVVIDINIGMQVKEPNENPRDTGHCLVTNLNENMEQHEFSNLSKIKTYIMPIEQIICMEPDSTQECHGCDNVNINSNAICLKVSDTHNKGVSDGKSENVTENLSCDTINNVSDTVAEKNKNANEELEECDSSQVYYYSNEVELYKTPQNQIHSTCVDSESACNLDDFSENQGCLLIEDECQLTDAIQISVTHVDECDMENSSSNDFSGDVSETTVLQLVLKSPSPTNLIYTGSNNAFDICENNTNFDCEEMWIDDVGCVETVVSEDVEQESDNEYPESPSQNCSNVSTLQLSDLTKNEKLNYFDSTKIKNIYGDNMDNNDIDLVETLYKTPHMDVRSKLMESKCNVRSKENGRLLSCDDSDSMDVNNSGEDSSKDENGHLSTSSRNKQLDGLPLEMLSHDFISNSSDDNDDQDGRNVLCERNIEDENTCFSSLPRTKPSDLDDLSLRQQSQSVSSRNSEDNHDNSVIICSKSDNGDGNHYLPLPQYEHSESKGSDKKYNENENFPRRKNYTENNLNLLHNIHTDIASNVYLSSPTLQNSVYIQETSATPISEMPYSNFHFRKTDKLITKAAQKYVPPLKISAHNFKVQLSLPEERLNKLKLLKINHQKNERSPIPKLKICTSQLQKSNYTKKLKPNFEDVLKHIDAAQYKLNVKDTHKKKNLNCIPKVIIKKHGSHYTSTSPAVKDDFNPDLTGNRWQPWVSLERCVLIEKMITRKKTKVIISSPTGYFTQQKGFRMKSQYSIDSIKEKPLKCMIMLKPKSNKINIPKSTQISAPSHTYKREPRLPPHDRKEQSNSYVG